MIDPLMICKIKGCKGRALAKGWCSKHYQRWFKYGDPKIVKKRGEARFFGCKVRDCDGKHDAKGYCSIHYRAFHKYGDPLIKLPHTKGRTIKARIAAMADLPDDLKEAYGLSRGGKRQRSEYGY
ncbi:hypothetical protein LCGC14_2793250 [marine sediment metagenome]|uniref:Nuclease associated modular domain-containing protein n=1 Tax=marine sediment metagenome TaxID=412755 RepID=A0A0F9BGA0_9ZZZZ